MLYDNLPGVKLTVKDGNLILPAEDLGTRRVLIIAPTTKTIEEGTMDPSPKLVSSSEDFEVNFGTFDKTNPLARYWKQVHDAGCRSIYLIELKGTDEEDIYRNLHDTYAVIEDAFETDIILLGGVYADTVVDNSLVDMAGSIRKDFGLDAGLAEVTATTATLNGDNSTTDIILTTPVDFDSIVVSHDDGVETVTTYVLGTDYTVDEDTYTVTLTSAPDTGETVTVDYNTYSTDFPSQLAGFCAEVSASYSQTIGVISMEIDETLTSSDLASIKTYVDGQTEQTYNQYLQVVGGAMLYFEINNEAYVDSFAGAYAGMISVLSSYSSPTNKTIPGVVFSVFNLSPAQVMKLTNESHIVVPRYKNGRIAVADAITTAPEASDFTRLTTLRITNDAVSLVRELTEPYIGEPNTLARRNALQTSIRSSLNNMVKRGALNDFRFNIKSTLSDQINGDMLIFLDIVPAFETRRINVTVALKPTLE